MKKYKTTIRYQRGFSLVEILLAVAVFVSIATALVTTLIYGQESTALAGARARAVFLAEEGLEATRNIRDANFTNLTNGTHGLAISSNQWNFAGSSDVADIFTRQIVISAVDADRKQAISTVTWQQNAQRTGEVSLISYLTNWQASTGAAPTCSATCVSLGYASGTCRANATQCTNNSEIYESSGDSECTGGGGADTCCCLPGAADTTAPSAIANLALSGATSSSINLAWTAPGDDGSTGTATTYDVRYSTATITEGNWASATLATGEPSPSVAGSSESMTVSGLTASTTYYFAIKTSDEVPNTAGISNVPSLATLAGTVTSCPEYCQSQNLTGGTCRKNPAACNQNNESHQAGGDLFCTGGQSADTCCCAP